MPAWRIFKKGKLAFANDRDFPPKLHCLFHAGGIWPMSGVVQMPDAKKDGIDSKKKGDPHG